MPGSHCPPLAVTEWRVLLVSFFAFTLYILNAFVRIKYVPILQPLRRSVNSAIVSRFARNPPLASVIEPKLCSERNFLLYFAVQRAKVGLIPPFQAGFFAARFQEASSSQYMRKFDIYMKYLHITPWSDWKKTSICMCKESAKEEIIFSTIFI